MSGLSQEHLNTYEKRYSPTSTNGHLSTAANFLVDSPYIDFCLNLAMADPGKGSGGPGSPPYFPTKMRPKGPKKCILETAPPPPPLLPKGLDPLLPSSLQRPLSCVPKVAV